MTERTQPTSGGRQMDLSAGYTPETRAILEDQGVKLFELIVEAGSISVADPRIADDGEYAEAHRALRDLGLVRIPDDDATIWIAVDPASVQSQVVTPMSQEGARLIQESAQWATDFTSLRSAWRRSGPVDERGPFTIVHSPGIGPFVASLVAECEEEVLTAQPQNRHDTGSELARATITDTDLLKRGAKMRTLYQHAARRNMATRDYVIAITKHGGEVRTLDEFFNRLLIFDRRIAVIPGPNGPSTAIAIREPAVVAYLVDVFERSWERGRPYTLADNATIRGIAGEQRAMTLRMLLGGHSDPNASKRLGVSPRTYAGYVADLKEEFDAETRFQLGYMIGRRGITGTDESGQWSTDDGTTDSL